MKMIKNLGRRVFFGGVAWWLCPVVWADMPSTPNVVNDASDTNDPIQVAHVVGIEVVEFIAMLVIAGGFCWSAVHAFQELGRAKETNSWSRFLTFTAIALGLVLFAIWAGNEMNSVMSTTVSG